MSLSKRLEEVEGHGLTPKEAVILWMGEAHQFDSMLDYVRWLFDQPDEAYPLRKMPAQVVAAVRTRGKGKTDTLLHDEIYRVQRDVLFLFYLHQQLNQRLVADEDTICLRLSLLTEKLRGLIDRRTARDVRRIETLELPEDPKKPLPRAKKSRARLEEEKRLKEDVAAWPQAERELRADLLCLRETADLLSRTYFGDEELLFPQSERRLEIALDMLAGLRGSYRQGVLGGPPEKDEEFLRWMIERMALDEGATQVLPVPPPEKDEPPDVTQVARNFAGHLISMAKAEALQALGKHSAGARLTADWVRRAAGW